MFNNVQGEYGAGITQITGFVLPKLLKSRIIFYAKNVENHAFFVEGLWPGRILHSRKVYEVFHVRVNLKNV